MSIRVLGGVAKGLELKVPAGATIRPTLVLLRRKIFDSVQNLEGRCFIDAFAGTGAMGIEAWSRGAQEVWLNEKERGVFRVLQDNVKRLQEKYPSETKDRPLHVQMGNFQNWWTQHYSLLERQQNKIFFIDPPYEATHLYQESLQILCKAQLSEHEIWIESDRQKGPSLPEILSFPLELLKLYEQGTSFIARLRNRS